MCCKPMFHGGRAAKRHFPTKALRPRKSELADIVPPVAAGTGDIAAYGISLRI
jgi:hypothetical protein